MPCNRKKTWKKKHTSWKQFCIMFDIILDLINKSDLCVDGVLIYSLDPRQMINVYIIGEQLTQMIIKNFRRITDQDDAICVLLI